MATNEVVAKISADISDYQSAMKTAAGYSRNFAKESEKTSAALDGVFQDKNGRWREANGRFVTSKEKLALLNGEANQSTGAFGKVTGAIGKTLKVAGGIALVTSAVGVLTGSVGGAVERFDTLNAYPKVMKQMGYSTTDTNKSMQILNKSIDGLPTTLQDITKSSQSFAILTGSATEGAKTASALNDAFLASGASAGDASRGVQQYSQMLSSGTVDLASWKTLQETMPYALQEVAKSFGLTGKSAQRDLYAKLQSGEITMDQLNQKFIELDGGVNGFAKTARTATGGIGTSFTNMRNAVTKGLANTITAIDNGFKNAGIDKGIAGIFDAMKVAINNSFTAVNGIIQAAIPVIVPIIKGLYDAIKSVVDFVSNNSDWIMPLVAGLGAFAGVIGAASLAVSGYNQIVKIGTGIQKAFNTIMAINPFVLIIAAVAAVVAGIVWWVTQTKSGQEAWKTFTGVVKNLWSGMVEFFSGIWTGIVNTFNVAVQILQGVWQGAVNIFQTIWSFLSPIVDGIIQAVVNNWNGFVKTLSGIWDGLVSVAKGVWELLKSVVLGPVLILIDLLTGNWKNLGKDLSLIWNSIKSAGSSIWNGLKGIVTSIVNGLVGSVKNVFNGLKSAVSGIWNGIKSLTSSAWNGIKSIAASLASGLVSGVKGAWSGLTGIVSGIWNGVKSAIKGAMNINLFSAGSAIMNGFLSGLKSVWGAITSFVGGIADWIRDHKGPISYDKKLLIPAGSAIMNGFGGSLQSNFETVKKNVASYAGQIADQFNGQQYMASATLTASSSGVAGQINGGLASLNDEVAEQTAQQPVFEVYNEIVGDKIKTVVNSKNARREALTKIINGG